MSVTVTCVNDPPVAGDDSFTGTNAALANTRLVVGTTSTGPNLTVAGSVLSNDTDVDSPPAGFTAGPATISSANCTGCNNVTLEADGNFIYDPPAGFTGNDTFTYTVNDNDPDTPANQTDTATVTIAGRRSRSCGTSTSTLRPRQPGKAAAHTARSTRSPP